jgi:hypothetical protein
MTRDEAIAECSRLAREHPDRATHSWLPRELAPGEWAVVKVGVPGQRPLGTMQEAKPRPPQPDDVRPAMWRNVGGPYGPG